jgi:hypothetical protein
MEHEQFTYPEALRWLAKKYNIEVQEEEVTTEQQQQNTERESLQRVNEFAAGQFAEWLWDHPKGQAIGLAYFRERGFTDATLKTFQLGFSFQGLPVGVFGEDRVVLAAGERLVGRPFLRTGHVPHFVPEWTRFGLWRPDTAFGRQGG